MITALLLTFTGSKNSQAMSLEGLSRVLGLIVVDFDGRERAEN